MKPYIWRTLKLGTYDGPISVQQALQRSDINLQAPTVKSALREVEYSTEKRVLNLALISVPELGIDASIGSEGASVADVVDAAKSFGLSPCPAEVGPLLRLDYLDQPRQSRIFICMKPLPVSKGMFQLRCDAEGVLHLGLHFSYNYRQWIYKSIFVFVSEE